MNASLAELIRLEVPAPTELAAESKQKERILSRPAQGPACGAIHPGPEVKPRGPGAPYRAVERRNSLRRSA